MMAVGPFSISSIKLRDRDSFLVLLVIMAIKIHSTSKATFLLLLHIPILVDRPYSNSNLIQ